MTKDEAIEQIKSLPIIRYEEMKGRTSSLGDALRLAIESLEEDDDEKIREETTEKCIRCVKDYFIEVIDSTPNDEDKTDIFDRILEYNKNICDRIRDAGNRREP